MTKRKPVCPPDLRVQIETYIARGHGHPFIAEQLGCTPAVVDAVRWRMDEINTEPDEAAEATEAPPPPRPPAPARRRNTPNYTRYPAAARDLLSDSVCAVGHAIYTVDDLTHDARCIRCEAEMRAERRSLGEAARERADRHARGVFSVVRDSLNDPADAGRGA